MGMKTQFGCKIKVCNRAAPIGFPTSPKNFPPVLLPVFLLTHEDFNFSMSKKRETASASDHDESGKRPNLFRRLVLGKAKYDKDKEPERLPRYVPRVMQGHNDSEKNIDVNAPPTPNQKDALDNIETKPFDEGRLFPEKHMRESVADKPGAEQLPLPATDPRLRKDQEISVNQAETTDGISPEEMQGVLAVGSNDNFTGAAEIGQPTIGSVSGTALPDAIERLNTSVNMLYKISALLQDKLKAKDWDEGVQIPPITNLDEGILNVQTDIQQLIEQQESKRTKQLEMGGPAKLLERTGRFVKAFGPALKVVLAISVQGSAVSPRVYSQLKHLPRFRFSTLMGFYVLASHFS